MRQVALHDRDQPPDEQPASDREREPGDDCDCEEKDPLRHGVNVGIGSDGYVLKGTFPSRLAAVGVASPKKEHAQALFAPLGPTYDRYARLLSFGQDPRWRRFLVSRIEAGAGDRVLDVATGTGAVALELLDRKGCTVVGLDQSAEMLQVARARLPESVELVEGEADALPFEDASFDGLTFTYLFRYVDDPGATLRELARVVRPGGTIAGLEFGVPPNPMARAAWRVYVGAGLPLAGRVISPGWATVGDFLGPSIRELWRRVPLPRLLELWREAGLADVAYRRMSLGGGIVIWGRRA
jgi:demethylmenaquinone methyltransferase/2-methoxy-6-polyprenyl-1,4-benzoquinol methylase